jgi:spermidine/putrescine transport system ATP-binding protein
MNHTFTYLLNKGIVDFLENITIENLTKSFDGFIAVNDVSLTIQQGEMFSFLGPSGCGKTTLLRMIAGFEVPHSGRILLGNQDITQLPPYKRQVNTIFQNYSLFPHMIVYDNVAFALRIKKLPHAEIDSRVKEMLQLVKMEDQAAKYPNTISGGQKQRVAIARALINKPQVLLLDEPLAALDLKLRQHMLLELMNIHDAVGITFIYVTHDQGEAMSISDRVAVMNHGNIIQSGPPDDIYERPASIFSAYFIGETNLIPAIVTSVQEDYVELNCNPEAEDSFEIDSTFHFKPTEGQKLTVSLRPEKIAISRTKPRAQDDINMIKGVIEDILYLGTHTQYIVKVGNLKFRVFNQHKRVYFDDKALDWEEPVWLFWHDSDSWLIDEITPLGMDGNDENVFERPMQMSRGVKRIPRSE